MAVSGPQRLHQRRAHEVIKCPTAPSGAATPEIGCTYTWYYNQGVVSLTVNGVTASAGYGQGSTDASVASALASAVNNDGSMPVTASLSSATLTLTSKGIGTGVNYSLGTSCTYSISYWTACSFSGSLSGSAMTGGSDVTDYDYGTVSAVINGQTVSASYGQNDSDSTVAANLATAINNNSSYATASASGSSLAITARGTGVNTNYPLSASSATGDSGQFSSPSFSASASGSSLTGGQSGQGSGAYSVTGITYAPDGDVTGANDSVNGQWQYEYDPLNRLAEACETNCASPTDAAGYVYDRFGNRWRENAIAGTIPAAPQLTFDANNHIVGASYDASGDLLADAAGHSYVYNAQHRIATADGGSIQYVYNAFGQRVEKLVGGVAKYYLYDPAGQAVTVLDQNGNWLRGEIFGGGRHFATYASNTTYFDYSDWLGTLRMRATLSGYEQDACASFPFGEGLACTGGADPSPLHFTGQQHDNETGLDYFPARNYTSTWARWMVPDWSPAPTAVPYANFVNPQSLDLYVYLMDNPVSGTDPTGHSHLVYDGAAHVIYLVAHGGAVVGHWPAANRAALRIGNQLTAGPLPSGRYAIRPADRHGARMHLGGSPSSAYGPGGIVHIRAHAVFWGRASLATGVGLHGGREGFPWMGYLSLTNGCVRTRNEGMLDINRWLHKHPSDPLHYLQVKNNQLDVRTWVRGAEEKCEAQTGTAGCKALAQYIGKHPNVLGGDSR